MEAHQGDQVVVEGTKIGQTRRSGQVVKVEGTMDHRRLWVRWEDGHESLFVPGPDTRVEERRRQR
jgi:hypothetical protein